MGESSKFGVLVDNELQDYHRKLVRLENNGSKRNMLGPSAEEAVKLKLTYDFLANPGLYNRFVNMDSSKQEWLEEDNPIKEERLEELLEPYSSRLKIEKDSVRRPEKVLRSSMGNDSIDANSRVLSGSEEVYPTYRMIMDKVAKGKYDEAIEDATAAFDPNQPVYEEFCSLIHHASSVENRLKNLNY